MYAGDELYDDDVTSGPATDDVATCPHGTPWGESCHAGDCFREGGPWPGDRDRDYDPLEEN